MPPETAQLFSQWKNMEGALFASGRRFLDRGADVGDLMQDAFLVLLEGRATWDPAKHPKPERFVFGLMKSRRANQLRHARVVRAHDQLMNGDTAPTPEGVLTDPKDAVRDAIVADLRERFAPGTLERSVLDLAIDEGKGDSQEVARLLGVAEEKVHRARRTLKDAGAELRAALERDLQGGAIAPDDGLRRHVVAPAIAVAVLTPEEERALDAASAMHDADLDAELSQVGTSRAALREAGRALEARAEAAARGPVARAVARVRAWLTRG